MNGKILEETLDTLKRMVELELWMGKLYNLCAVNFPEESAFFGAIEAMEIKHSQNITRMIKLVSDNPDNFQVGRRINSIVIKNFISDIEGTIRKIQSNEINFPQILFFAQSYENSIIEKKYNEFLLTASADYTALSAEIVQDTVAHAAAFTKKLAEVNKR